MVVAFGNNQLWRPLAAKVKGHHSGIPQKMISLVRRVWRVPWRTHCENLPHFAGVMAPEKSFAINAITFTNLLMESENQVVKMISGMGMFGYHYV